VLGLSQNLSLGPLADASVVTDDDFGAGRGSLSPSSSVADLRPNRDAAVDKFSVSISSFLLKMGSLERPLHEAPGRGLTDRLLQGVLSYSYHIKFTHNPSLFLLRCITLSVNYLP